MARRNVSVRRAPALVLATALALGILLAEAGLATRVIATGFAAGGAGSIILLATSGRSARPLIPITRLVATVVVVASCGALRLRHHQHLTAPWVSLRAPTAATIDVTGSVAETRITSSGRGMLVLSGVAVADRINLPGKLAAYARSPLAPERVGDRIRLTGQVVDFPQPRNPGEFDFGRTLRRRAILCVMSADTVRVLHKRAGPPGITYRVRSYVSSTLVSFVSSPESRALLEALVLGNRGGIDPRLRESFVATGLVHLLAVSGLHVMIVGLLFYRLAGPLLLRLGLGWRWAEPARSALTLGVLSGYAMLTGMPSSVVRAVLMTAALLAGPPLRRRSNSLNSLGVATISILLWSPLSLFEPGFQLSVSAVAGIVVLSPHLSVISGDLVGKKRASHPLATGLHVSVAASLSTLPALLMHFGRASFAGIPLNAAAIPATTIALLSGVLCIMTSPAPALAAAFGSAADLALRFLVGLTVEGERRLAFLSFRGSLDSEGLILLAGLVVALTCFRHRGRLALLLTVTLALLACVAATRFRSSARLEVHFLDVGQGDAALIRMPQGVDVLLDAGPGDTRFDAGKRIVVPYLRRLGVEHLDALVLSHAHSDHVGGAVSVLRSVRVDRLITPVNERASPRLEHIRQIADSLGASLLAVRRGDILDVGVSARMFVLAPGPEVYGSTDENDRSVVMRIDYGSTSLLMMGDAERLTEAQLVRKLDPLLPVDLVKVGHHGSSTSSSPGFVERVSNGLRPGAVAVISSGRRNRYGHPSRTVISRWSRAGWRPMTTADQGAIIFRSDGRTVRRRQWRRRRLTDSETSGEGTPSGASR